MRYFTFLILILSFSLPSEARLFGRGGGWGWRRPIFRRMPMRTVSSGCRNGSCQPRSCGANGCSPQNFNSNQAHASDAPFPGNDRPVAESTAPAEQPIAAPERPVSATRSIAELTAPVGDDSVSNETFSIAEASKPTPKPPTEKEKVIAELETQGWRQDYCTADYCVLKKDDQQKKVFNDGKVEDTVSEDAVQAAIGSAVSVETEAKKENEQPKPVQKHGFRYVKGSGHGISASQLDQALQTEAGDAGTSKVLITFGTTWCGPCREFNNSLSQVTNQNYQGITAIKVLVDNTRSTSLPNGVSFRHPTYPTAYVISKDAAGNLDFKTMKQIQVGGQAAKNVLGNL